MKNIIIKSISKKLICSICDYDEWYKEDVVVSLTKDYNFSCSKPIVMLTCINCKNILFFEKDNILMNHDQR